MSVYLDYNASGLVRPEALKAAAEALADNGNPSAVHAAGRRARARIETARAEVAALVGVEPSSVIFSSGGTESNAQAMNSALRSGFERLIIGATEHPCVAEAAAMSGREVTVIPVDRHGVVSLEAIEAALNAGGPAFVAIHHANNESGVIQPIAEIAALVRAHGGWLHVDAVQSAGKIPARMDDLGCDTLTLSAHKLGGPQGIGALIAGPRATVHKTLFGAGQERGLRAGTENVPGIAGFGAAAACARAELEAGHDHADWRDAAAQAMKAMGAVVAGDGVARLPNTLFAATPGWASMQQLMALDLAGVMVSGGSACSSGKAKPSTALVAMGMDDLATSAIRVSGGWGTTEADWTRFATAWTEALTKQRARHPEMEPA
ncbi:cysteine desulfurase family protein [Brevundimonas sp.]|uniref:cysteine desulfurase family protein n=1 Tax=Brevundimonas sp. TaxID=1871086 RepID=UPI0025EA8794|nr:cysteine desulfurase family protein [Brevundimonas sp.]